MILNFDAKIQIRWFARFCQDPIFGQKYDFWHSVVQGPVPSFPTQEMGKCSFCDVGEQAPTLQYIECTHIQ